MISQTIFTGTDVDSRSASLIYQAMTKVIAEPLDSASYLVETKDDDGKLEVTTDLANIGNEELAINYLSALAHQSQKKVTSVVVIQKSSHINAYIIVSCLDDGITCEYYDIKIDLDENNVMGTPDVRFSGVPRYVFPRIFDDAVNLSIGEAGLQVVNYADD